MRPALAAVLAVAVAVATTPLGAQGRRFACGSFDRPSDAQDLPYTSGPARSLRAAAGAYCARATGDQRRDCAFVMELLRRGRCPFELHPPREGTTTYAAIGIHPARVEWVWYLVLSPDGGSWRVVGIDHDDLERP